MSGIRCWTTYRHVKAKVNTKLADVCHRRVCQERAAEYTSCQPITSVLAMFRTSSGHAPSVILCLYVSPSHYEKDALAAAMKRIIHYLPLFWHTIPYFSEAAIIYSGDIRAECRNIWEISYSNCPQNLLCSC